MGPCGLYFDALSLEARKLELEGCAAETFVLLINIEEFKGCSSVTDFSIATGAIRPITVVQYG